MHVISTYNIRGQGLVAYVELEENEQAHLRSTLKQGDHEWEVRGVQHGGSTVRRIGLQLHPQEPAPNTGAIELVQPLAIAFAKEV